MQFFMAERILYAIGHRQFEDKVTKGLLGKYPDKYEVVGAVVHKEAILDTIKENGVDILVVREKLPGSLKSDVFTIVLNIRTKFPKVRIIFVADDRKPGDKLLAKLVSYNIYDIHAGCTITVDKLVDLIANPRQFKDVAYLLPEPEENLFDDFGPQNNKEKIIRKEVLNEQKEEVKSIVEQDEMVKDEENFKELKNLLDKVADKIIPNDKDQDDYDYIDARSNKKVKIIKEEKIIQKVIGTATIAVTHLEPRVGATHLCLSLSRFISEQGHRVAVIEAHESTNFRTIRDYYKEVNIVNEQLFKLYNIDFYCWDDLNDISDIIMFNDYKYIILDMGIFGNDHFDDFQFKLCNKKIFVNRSLPYQLNTLEDFIKAALDNDNRFNYLKKLNYYLTFCDDDMFEERKKDLPGFHVFKGAYIPNPFKLTDEARNVFSDMLSDLLPKEKVITKNESKINFNISNQLSNLFSTIGKVVSKK